jgi:hypothetical protein
MTPLRLPIPPEVRLAEARRLIAEHQLADLMPHVWLYHFVSAVAHRNAVSGPRLCTTRQR